MMALLKPGELACGIKAKSDAKRKSAEKMIEAIQTALREPDKVTADMLAACQTQHSLAAWQSETFGIMPMSLNTLKKHIDELYEGGWKGFLELCQRLVSRASEPVIKPGTKDHMTQEIERLKAENDRLLSSVLQASAQYLELLRDFSELAKSHVFLQERIQRHLKKYPTANRGLYVIEGGKDAGATQGK